MSSCKKDTSPIDYGYMINIHSPSTNSNYSTGDTLPISVIFSSETGEIVHYISVEIFTKQDESLKLYSVQAHQHIPEYFEYNDDFVLKDTSKIEGNKQWILEASMWSHGIATDTLSTTLELEIE